jgi:hypothetical protein
VPLTVAAAATALAISLVAVRDARNGSMVPPNPATSTSRANLASPGGVPRYYLAIATQSSLVAGDSVTGKTIAEIAAPAHTNFLR